MRIFTFSTKSVSTWLISQSDSICHVRVLIFGTFDRLHPGHCFVFEEALARGDVFAVVARDSNVLRLKGHLPDQSERERVLALEKNFPSIHCVLGDSEDFLVPVQSIQPDLILLGYDQKLPPGVTEECLPCPIERLPAYKPEEFKSSLRRKI